MSETKIDYHLQECKEWAKAKIKSRMEPPWAWFQYMKLIETIGSIQESRATKGGSPQSDQRPETVLRLVGEEGLQETTPHRPEKIPVHLPM